MKSTITPEELKKTLKSAYIIDVREPDEYQQDHIEGSHHLPLGKLIRDASKEIFPLDKQIVVHCKSGVRGGIALEFLKKKGYKNVQNLEGGFDSWKCSQ